MRERAGGASSWTSSALSRRPTVRTDGALELNVPGISERVKLLMRGFVGSTETVRLRAPLVKAHPEHHYSANARDTGSKSRVHTKKASPNFLPCPLVLHTWKSHHTDVFGRFGRLCRASHCVTSQRRSAGTHADLSTPPHSVHCQECGRMLRSTWLSAVRR